MENTEKNMVQLIVFDLDSTLAPLGKGIGRKELELFQKIEKKGIRIATASGKTCDYLCGFMRQVGLGDGVNDYCMFEMAGYSVGVNVKEPDRVNKNCTSTLEMLEYLSDFVTESTK